MKPLQRFLRSEASGGLLLMATAALALVVANSPLAPTYFDALHAEVGGLSLLHWINDGLMALFFLTVGAEIKRELHGGELSTWRRRALPGLAAVGGMAVPALIYLAVAGNHPGAAPGWAIPSATDIAFALAVIQLLGPRAPATLKLFLAALAIIDDLGAVVIIAVVYSKGVSLLYLGLAAAATLVLVVMNRCRVRALPPYLLVGLGLWIFLLKSGVHATLAGVILAFCVPRGAPLRRLEHRFHPWVAYIVLPVFGFANAGMALGGGVRLLDQVPLAVALGLLIGKPIGVFGAAWLAVRLKLAELPAGAGRLQVFGVAVLCGIGFTMSLFIGQLAFDDPVLQEQAKLGVLAGSLVAGIVGYLILRVAAGRTQAERAQIL